MKMGLNNRLGSNKNTPPEVCYNGRVQFDPFIIRKNIVSRAWYGFPYTEIGFVLIWFQI